MAKSKKSLDRARIVKAAFAVLNEEGLDGLSLRMVAQRLDVQAPALYWHVKNKAEMASLMAATFSVEAERAEAEQKGWRARLLVFGRSLRHAMLRHRDAARLCVGAHSLESPEAAAHRLAVPLIQAGLDARTATSYRASVIAYTLGWVVYEQSQQRHEFLEQLIDFDKSFEAGLSAMVRGFEAPGRA